MHDLNNNDKIRTFVKNPVKIELNCNNIIDDIFIPFFKILFQYDIKPYQESNSGFYELCIDVQFKNKSIPIIHKFYNWSPSFIDEKYLDEYYKWINNCIVNQHFGIQLHDQIIKPICGCVNHKKIKYSIIENIFLEFKSLKFLK